MNKFNTTLISILFLAITNFSFAQGKVGLYKVNSDLSETKINNDETIDFGNPGISSSILSHQVKVKNESSTEVLSISNITFDKEGVFGFFPYEGDMEIQPNESGSFYIYYSASSNINVYKGSFSFSTSDASFPTVKINAIVNKDDGELKITSADYPVVDNQIDLGDVVIGSTKYFTLEMDNVGEGFMYVGKTEFENAGNSFASDYSEKKGFSSGTAYNNNFSFKATTKGKFETIIKHSLERGQTDIHKVKVIGNVLAPEVKISYDGNLLLDNNTINEDPVDYSTKQFIFNVVNNGNADLTINGVTLNQSNANEYNMSYSGSFKTIKPKESLMYTLELIPSSIGQKDIEITFNTTDTDRPKIKVDFSTLVEAALIQFEDKDGNKIEQGLGFDMRSTTDNAIVKDELYIKNIGNKTLNITKFEEVYDIHNQLSSDYAGGTIAPNSRQKVTFTYSPNGHNAYKNSYPFDILSNAHENKDIRYNVHAYHQYHETELRYEGNLVDESYPIDFGRFDINKEQEVTLLVKNSGTLPLQIKSVVFKDVAQSSFKVKSFTSEEVVQGENAEVVIVFDGDKAFEHYEEVLQVETSDYKNPIQSVGLRANPVKSEFYMSNPENTITVWNGDIEEYGPLSYDRDFEYTYEIKNRGEGPLRINGISAELNDGYDLEFSDFVLPIILQAGEKQNITMHATPKKPGQFDTKVHITTDEPGANNFSYTVRMLSQLPVLEVINNNEVIQPTTIEFNNIRKYALTLLNRGNEIMDLNEISILDNNEFSVEYDNDITFLRPNESLEVRINYSPQNSSKEDGQFVVKTNDKKLLEFTLVLKEGSITSIDQQLAKIEVFPIPAENTLTINGLSQQVEIRIFDMFGVKHLETTSNATVDISSLSAGMYLLDIDGRVMKKIMIK
ncbi:choice-of-anchor D domain-containing protein [Flammeovirga sp. MY04]|uniref:choice-of-anchor D domain-containing protein n=1 Tax=Flammeovirga sp. MY04 TaxID=1191459 RepID=UPI0008062FA6|nr:choice-of-anchor D domain-containing protein [Flammeovirga sp. MY04]ANQ47831.1 choice-of-anchor D domain-containing protein [Flammeovirga sp. MY04]